MRILITGGKGRLARHLVAELMALGHEVDAPSHAELPGDDYRAVAGRLQRGFDLVVSAAARTDVPSTSWPAMVEANTLTIAVTSDRCLAAGIPCIYLSSDYALPHDGDPTVYDVSKRRGEKRAAENGASIVRVCFADKEQARGWGWVNGYTRSNREWTEGAAHRLAAFVDAGAWRTPRKFNLGPERATTRAEMLREWMPDHPTLAHVVTSQEEHRTRVGYAAPTDTRFPTLWRP